MANILCGYFSFDTTGAEPLLSLLPSVVVIPLTLPVHHFWKRR
ncbi:cupin domain-containing protein [Klebsiella pneumoniae subsp. pneumoniae]|nr:cupin domain-containing protein [Klebsiella pneumoniae subsp. pneumoniae]